MSGPLDAAGGEPAAACEQSGLQSPAFIPPSICGTGQAMYMYSHIQLCTTRIVRRQCWEMNVNQASRDLLSKGLAPSIHKAHVLFAIGCILVLVLVVQLLQRSAVEHVAGVHVGAPRLAAQVACREGAVATVKAAFQAGTNNAWAGLRSLYAKACPNRSSPPHGAHL